MDVDDPDQAGDPSIRRSWRGGALLRLLCLLLLQGGCAWNLGGDAAEKMRSIAHPGGLALVVPESLDVKEEEHGFLISSPISNDRREGASVTVRLRGPAWSLTAEYLQSTRVAGHPVYYRIDEEHGLTGESEYRFTAWVPSGEGYIELSQVEPNRWPDLPEFELAWTIITGIIRKESS